MQIADISNPLVPALQPTSKGANTPELFSSVLRVVIQSLFIGGFILFTVYFILGAYQWITSSGDQKALEKARNSVIHAIVGMVVMLALFAILSLFESVFGISILQIDLTRIKI